MTGHSNPFDTLEEMFERMSRQFEEASRSWEAGERLDFWAPEWGRQTMPLDLEDRQETFVATVEVPGFDREEIRVRVTDHTVHVEADREAESEETDRTYVRRERTRHSTSRSIRVPTEIDAEGVEASLDNGVLTITIPKAEPGREPDGVEIDVA